MRTRHFFPATQRRVEQNTGEKIRNRIQQATERSVASHAHSPESIDRRLAELQQEWDIERALETNAALVVLTTLALGIFVNRRWLALTAIASGFLLQHALQGWCPPLPIMRRLGVRTYSEIDEEKEALRILRGDFETTDSPAEAIAQARAVPGANGRRV